MNPNFLEMIVSLQYRQVSQLIFQAVFRFFPINHQFKLSPHSYNYCLLPKAPSHDRTLYILYVFILVGSYHIVPVSFIFVLIVTLNKFVLLPFVMSCKNVHFHRNFKYRWKQNHVASHAFHP